MESIGISIGQVSGVSVPLGQKLSIGIGQNLVIGTSLLEINTYLPSKTINIHILSSALLCLNEKRLLPRERERERQSLTWKSSGSEISLWPQNSALSPPPPPPMWHFFPFSDRGDTFSRTVIFCCKLPPPPLSPLIIMRVGHYWHESLARLQNFFRKLNSKKNWNKFYDNLEKVVFFIIYFIFDVIVGNENLPIRYNKDCDISIYFGLNALNGDDLGYDWYFILKLFKFLCR